MLADYPWPGNIRELKNLFERTVLLRERGSTRAAATSSWRPRARVTTEATLRQRDRRRRSTAPIGADGIPFEVLVEELERALIVRASCATKWNQSRTAELLNLKRDKLRYRMKLYELQPEKESSDPTHKVA